MSPKYRCNRVVKMYALYSRNVYVLGGLFAVLAFQIILSSYGLSSGVAVPLPPGVTGCILTGPVKSATFPAVWYTPAITDAIIFALTVYRAKTAFRSRSAAPTIRQFVKDGVLYFLVIFAANLSNVLTFAFAVDDLKAFGASFSQLITSVMISRLLLNLRGIGEKKTSRNTLICGRHAIRRPDGSL
ncbi:hypothetical protein DL96DRAFT_325852 [Flagelloscypha sp. PMI_526]|nr:hypothetical protein DL96DRAFT_325852 [Flagelloscypha sp. PMI_526]